MSNKNNNTVDSLILNLETLIKEYDILLIQYNQVQNDYIHYLQNQNINPRLVTIKNSAFWGKSGISSSNIKDMNTCVALCSNTPGCSGATFNKTNGSENNCWLRSGEGMVIAGSEDQYAIIPESINYLLTLEQLNLKLKDVNNKILQIFQSNDTLFKNIDKTRIEKYQLLKQNYKYLELQRLKILNELKKYNNLEEQYNQSQLIVQKNYYNYILLLFILILCFLLLSDSFTNFIGQTIVPFLFSYASIILILIVSVYFLYYFSYLFSI